MKRYHDRSRLAGVVSDKLREYEARADRPLQDDEEEHEHDDFDTVTINISPSKVPTAIVESVKLALAQEGVLRIKGISEVEGSEARLVIQGVGNRVDWYYDRPWQLGERRQNKLVVIGLKGFDFSTVKTILNK